MLKETKFSEVEKSIQCVSELYNCDNIYSLTEEDGTTKNTQISLCLRNKFCG